MVLHCTFQPATEESGHGPQRITKIFNRQMEEILMHSRLRVVKRG